MAILLRPPPQTSLMRRRSVNLGLLSLLTVWLIFSNRQTILSKGWGYPKCGNETFIAGLITTQNTPRTLDRLHHVCVALSERDSSYSWIGNTWIPPTGVPRFTPDDMRNVLQRENTLFVGDSTARQDYFTMYNLMNVIDNDDSRDITYEQLNHGINFNKGGRNDENCTLREDQLSTMLSVCRQIPRSNVTDNLPATTPTQPNHNATHKDPTGGSFDLTVNPEPHICFSSISDFVNESTVASHYSIVIYSLGIWEVVRPRDCRNSGLDSLSHSLSLLQEFSERTQTIIVWKTHGGSFMENEKQRNFTQSIQDVARKWFETHQPRNMILVDFGTQVVPRTYGNNRISGDVHAHFGADARTLSLQMIIDAIYKQKCEQLDQGSD
ncbi:hypothetical protein IV203_005090 [Nitzschia inconspicua]|uniref:Uncharacterized protein n=1 Tax=Nitzschia inconspicua TaxID=303405 RepID=A0A9K3KLN3_9STRA|nr:hypothetical protein IV203_005090 [Nitzschia inconspicua]